MQDQRVLTEQRLVTISHFARFFPEAGEDRKRRKRSFLGRFTAENTDSAWCRSVVNEWMHAPTQDAQQRQVKPGAMLQLHSSLHSPREESRKTESIL